MRPFRTRTNSSIASVVCPLRHTVASSSSRRSLPQSNAGAKKSNAGAKLRKLSSKRCVPSSSACGIEKTDDAPRRATKKQNPRVKHARVAYDWFRLGLGAVAHFFLDGRRDRHAGTLHLASERERQGIVLRA